MLSFIPKIIGKGAAFVAQYTQKKPGETNIISAGVTFAALYFGVDKADVISALEGIINLLK